MIDKLLKNLFEYFKDQKNPLHRKIFIGILSLIGLHLLNEYTGFTHYYSVAKEVEVICNIENVKFYTNNQNIIDYLNKKENDMINRKDFCQQPNIYLDVLLKIFPEMPCMSRFWHALTSVFCFLFLSILLMWNVKEEAGKGLGSLLQLVPEYIFIAILSSGVILLIHFLFGLMPVMLNRAYINYVIQVFFIYFLFFGGEKKETIQQQE